MKAFQPMFFLLGDIGQRGFVEFRETSDARHQLGRMRGQAWSSFSIAARSANH
jgi:hypothetical protein